VKSRFCFTKAEVVPKLNLNIFDYIEVFKAIVFVNSTVRLSVIYSNMVLYVLGLHKMVRYCIFISTLLGLW
jgi:hypothetical protein